MGGLHAGLACHLISPPLHGLKDLSDEATTPLPPAPHQPEERPAREVSKPLECAELLSAIRGTQEPGQARDRQRLAPGLL